KKIVPVRFLAENTGTLEESERPMGFQNSRAGKSTLGNLLLGQPHDEGPFIVSEKMDSCTQLCVESEVTIDDQKFNIVDTPGIFDTSRPNEEIYKEIAETVQKCAYGIKAILFVFEAKRFTEEQGNVLNGIKAFLGESALNYIIAVFSHATKKQNADKDEMRKAWNPAISTFIGSIGNRWGISPDSDYFPPEHENHQLRLREIKDFIISTSGFYTTDIAYQEEMIRMKNEFEQKQQESLTTITNQIADLIERIKGLVIVRIKRNEPVEAIPVVSEGSQINLRYPVILLVGRTGNTLGNLLLNQPYDEGPFIVSDNMASCTQVCGESEVIIDGARFNIVDTPGIFDTSKPDEEIYKEIAKTVQKCAYGVKAILFVFEAKRFTKEQGNVLNGIRAFLGEGALNYIIAIFSHATKKQNADRDEMRKAWNPTITSFIGKIGNRWGISPNSDYYPPEHEKHQSRLREIKDFIMSTSGCYTTDMLESARQEQEKIQREKQEEENRLRVEHEERLRREGKEKADKEFQEQMIRMRSEFDQKQNESLAAMTNKISELQRQLADRDGGCFALDTKVQLSNGKLIEMAELQVGDIVLSNVKNNHLEFSEVYLISHLGHRDQLADMAKLNFTNPDGSKGYIRMTPTHCIFNSDLSLLYAHDIVPGETKILVLNKLNELVPVVIDWLDIEKDTSYISFYTRSGTVVANNMLCSCYDDCPKSQLLMDLVFAPIRLWTKVFPSTHRQKELHLYAQILETSYVLWCKVTIPVFSEGSQINLNYPIQYYQGAGKSTLGNLLLDQSHDGGPFVVSDAMDSCTQICRASEVTIDGQKFNIVDTPGIFDTSKPDEEVFKEIAKTVQKCAHGVRAILFVFEAKRFTEEQKNVLNNIKTFLGEDALNYMIAVFSHATKKQNEDKDEMRKAWDPTVAYFISSIGNRWGISPNSDYFPPEHQKHQLRLREIKDFIISTSGSYTTHMLELARQEQERIQREKQEEERRIREEHEERLRREEKERADRAHQEEINRRKEEFEQRQRESLAAMANQAAELQRQLANRDEGCFALDTKVQLSNGKLIEMAGLQVGDFVLSNVKNNHLEFSEVYLISHLGHHDQLVDMVKLIFTNPDGSKGYIRMTPAHCIFNSDLSLLYAHDIVPGETKILVLNKSNELVPVVIDWLDIEKDTSYISFYTRSGTVVANNMLCSCYDDCPKSQLLMDLVFAPIRLWTKVFPSTHRQKELHPYVQILETSYVLWCKALKKIKMIGKKAVIFLIHYSATKMP
ncbi:22320_t:CDS:10, partial [Cetraspora pellucida]